METCTRTYYRNNFFHVGHLKTILDNERFAKKNNGICYAIIDDRQDSRSIANIAEDFKYLELKHVKIISVKQYQSKIMDITVDLVRKGSIYLCHYNKQEHEPEVILKLLKKPTEHFQLRLKCGTGFDNPCIGYTYDEQGTGCFKLTLIFDYIIKILDLILGVTDIISTLSIEISDVKDENISRYFKSNILHHRLNTYHIDNFKYSKRGWNINDEANPYLLTFKGLRARHIPPIILKAFYLHACQMGNVNIKYLSSILSTYLHEHNIRTFGVMKPVKVYISDWTPKKTEYVCTSNASGKVLLHPLNGIFYVDRDDIGMDRKINIGRELFLSSGPKLLCTEIDNTEHNAPEIKTMVVTNSHKNYRMSINWVSSAWDSKPCLVRFYMYNWFYTGFNELLDPEITDGYIDQNVFSDLDKIYHIMGQGYFVYDRDLSSLNCIPTFLRICK